MNAASDCSVSPPGIAPCNVSSCGGGVGGDGITSLQAENPEAYVARDFVSASCGLGRHKANPLSSVNSISGVASAGTPAAAPSDPNSPVRSSVSREASAGASGLRCSRQPQLLAVQSLGIVPPLSPFASTAQSLANQTGTPNGTCPFPRYGSPPAFAVSPSAVPRSGSLDPSTWLISSPQASDRRTQLARQLSSPLASRASISPARVFGLQAVSPLRTRASLAPRSLAETFFGLCSSAGGSSELNRSLVHGLLPSDSPAAGDGNAVSHPGLVSAGSPPSTGSPLQARSCERQRPNATAPSSASVSNFCEPSVSASTSDVGSPSAANTLQETELCSVASPSGVGSAPAALSNANPKPCTEPPTDGEQKSSAVRARPGEAPRIQTTSGGPLSGEPREVAKNDASAEKRKTNSVRWRASLMSNPPEKTPPEIRAKTPEARRRQGSQVRSRPRSTSTLSGQVRGTKQPQAAVSPSLSATLEASRGDSLRSRCRSPVPERSHSVSRHQSALGGRGRRPPTTSGSTKSPSPDCRARPSSRAGSRRPGRLLMPRAEVRPSSSFGVLSSHSFSGGRLPLDIKELKKLHKHPLTGKPSTSLSSVTTLPAVREPNCPALRERAVSVSVGAQKALNKKSKARESRPETPTSSPSPAHVRDASTRRKGLVSVGRNGGKRSSSTRPVSRRRVSIDPSKKREKTESLASRSRSASPTPVDPVLVKARRSASRLSGQSPTLGGTKGAGQRKTPLKQRTRSGTCIRPGSVVYEPSRHVVTTPRSGSPALRAASTVLTRRQRSRGRHSSVRPPPRGMSQRESSLSSSETDEASSGSDTRSPSRLMRSSMSLKVRSMSSAFAEGSLRLLRPPSFELAASSDRSSPESCKASSTVSLCSGAASATELSTLPGLGQNFLTVGVCASAPEGNSDGRGSGSSTYRRASCASSVGSASSDWSEVPGRVASTPASRLPPIQAQARRQHPGRDESDTEGGLGLALTRSCRRGSVSSGYSSTERRSPRLQETRAPQLRNPSTADPSPHVLRPLAPPKAGTAPRGVQLPRLNLHALGQSSQEAPKRVESGEAPKKGPGERAPMSAPHGDIEGHASTAGRPRLGGALPKARQTSDDAREWAKGGKEAGTPRVPGDRDHPVQGRKERSPQSRKGTRQSAERHGPPKQSQEVAKLSLSRRSTMGEVSPRALAGAGALEYSAVRQRASTSSASHGRSRAPEETDKSAASQDSVADAVKTTGGELRHSASKEISLLKKSANAPPSPRTHVTVTQRAKPAAFPSRGHPTGAAEPLSKKRPAGGSSSIDLSEAALREQERTRGTPSRPRLSALPGSLAKSKVSPPGPPGPRPSHWETPHEARDASDTHSAKVRHPSGRADAGALSASVLSGEEGLRGGLEPQELSDLTLQNSPNIKRLPLRKASVSSVLSDSPSGGAGGRVIAGARKNFASFRGAVIAAKVTRTHVAAKARPSESSQASAGTLSSPSDSLRTLTSFSPRRMQRPSGAKDLSRPSETRRANLTATPASSTRRSDSEVPSLRIEKSSRGYEGAGRRASGLPGLLGLGDSAEKAMSRAGSSLKVAPGKLAKKAPASPRDTRLLSRSLTRSSVLLELPGEKPLGGVKRPKAKASGKAAAGRKRADASPQKRTGKTQPVGAASKSQVVEETPKTPEFCVKDLPMPARRIQPRVYVPDGFFLPVREGPQLERSRLMRSFHQDLCRPGPRGLYDRTLYGMALELSLLMPTDLKNLKRWLHESVAEVEEERQELADVWGFLEVLPSFCMVNEPLDFVLAYRDETRWREWGAGWMGKNGRPLPLPPDKLLRAFFFAEGLEGGPDWECKMMKREEENMRRFMKEEAEKLRQEEEHQRLLEKEAELQNLIRFKAKRWRQLQCMWEKLVEAIELHQRPRLSFVSSLDDGFPPSTSVATWLHPERQRASIAAPWIAAPTYLSCCSDAVTGDPSEASTACWEGCVSSPASPAVSVAAAEPAVVTISSLSELQARARRSESYARALHAMQQTQVMPSPDYVRHLFRERKFRELNRVFRALVGASIEDLWVHFDLQEAEAEAARATRAAAQEAKARAVAAAEARRRRAEEARAREPLEREEMAREDERSHQCEAFTWKDGNLRRKKQEFLKSIPISASTANAVDLLMTKTKRGTRPRSSGDTKLVNLRRAGSSSSASGPTQQKRSEKRDAIPAGHTEALPRGQETQGLISRRQSQMVRL